MGTLYPGKWKGLPLDSPIWPEPKNLFVPFLAHHLCCDLWLFTYQICLVFFFEAASKPLMWKIANGENSVIYLMMSFEFNFCQGKSALIYRTRHPLLNPKVVTHWMESSLHLVSGWASCDSLWWSIFQLLCSKPFHWKVIVSLGPWKHELMKIAKYEWVRRGKKYE